MEKATTTTSSSSTDQTHDFMNVDSFSQLPFIRPSSSSTTTKDKSPSNSGLRLFGIDFSSSTAAAATTTSASDSGESSTDTPPQAEPETTAKDTTTAGVNGESGRKFECHYCCRNFPTSQALGGHQNAHKRERQHAKRAHLHSAMIAADHHHLYGLAGHHYNHRPPNPYYPTTPASYNTSRYTSYSTYSPTTTNNTHFSLHHHQPPTINGSPLAVWRAHPTTGIHRDRSLPLFLGSVSAGIDGSGPKSNNSTSGSSFSSMSMSMSRTTAPGFDHGEQFNRNANGHDQVSLDLHL